MKNLYRPLYRHASFCTLPQGVAWEYAEAPRGDYLMPHIPRSNFPFGIIATARKLTEEECKTYELEAR